MDTQRASNPVEKNILHRLLPLQYLDLDLVFVFDGPKRPSKKGFIPAIPQPKEVALFKELLQALGIPYHEAPGEAEAQCAAMAKSGVVDVVWSEDSDTLMFGCPILLRNHMEGRNEKSKTKSKTHVQVHKSSILEEQYGIDQNGMRMFALLVGCDYNVSGLRGCGPAIATKVAKALSQEGLCSETHTHNYSCWRRWIQQYFQKDPDRRKIAVPDDFPSQSTVNCCITPVESEKPELLAEFERWQAERTAKIDERRLRELLQSKFNCREGEWFQKIEPLLWVKSTMNGISDAGEARISAYKVDPIYVGETIAKVRLVLTKPLHTVKGTPIKQISFETLASVVKRAYPEGMSENVRLSSRNKVSEMRGSRRSDVEDPTPGKSASTKGTEKSSFAQVSSDIKKHTKTPFTTRSAMQTTSQDFEILEDAGSSSPPDITSMFRTSVQGPSRERPRHNVAATAGFPHINNAPSSAKRSLDDDDSNEIVSVKQCSRPLASSKKLEAPSRKKTCIETIELSD